MVNPFVFKYRNLATKLINGWIDKLEFQIEFILLPLISFLIDGLFAKQWSKQIGIIPLCPQIP